MNMDKIGWSVNDGMAAFERAVLALFAPSAEEMAAREKFRAESLANLARQVDEEFQPRLAAMVEHARGPVACADCWAIVDDAPIGCSILCSACREEALVGRS